MKPMIWLHFISLIISLTLANVTGFAQTPHGANLSASTAGKPAPYEGTHFRTYNMRRDVDLLVKSEFEPDLIEHLKAERERAKLEKKAILEYKKERAQQEAEREKARKEHALWRRQQKIHDTSPDELAYEEEKRRADEKYLKAQQESAREKRMQQQKWRISRQKMIEKYLAAREEYLKQESSEPERMPAMVHMPKIQPPPPASNKK